MYSTASVTLLQAGVQDNNALGDGDHGKVQTARQPGLCVGSNDITPYTNS